jgi:hypothetical protein
MMQVARRPSSQRLNSCAQVAILDRSMKAYPETGGWLSGSDRPLRWPTDGSSGRPPILHHRARLLPVPAAAHRLGEVPPAGGELSGAAIGAAFRRERYARRTFCTRRSPGEPYLPLQQLGGVLLVGDSVEVAPRQDHRMIACEPAQEVGGLVLAVLQLRAYGTKSIRPGALLAALGLGAGLWNPASIAAADLVK